MRLLVSNALKDCLTFMQRGRSTPEHEIIRESLVLTARFFAVSIVSYFTLKEAKNLL